VSSSGALLVHNYGSARRDLRFQLLNLNRFSPNNSKVLFHLSSPFQKMWFKNKTGCEKADSPLAARLTWPHKQIYTRVASVFSGVSLEALRRRLSAVLPLSAGIHRKGRYGRIAGKAGRLASLPLAAQPA